MASESVPPAERAYPYWRGWHVVGCAVVFFGVLGSIFVSFVPIGYEKVQKGQLPTGVALMVMGAFGAPTLFMSFLSLWTGVRDTFRPPLLRLTATALLLPADARGEAPLDEHGEPTSQEPLHPDTIPLNVIRSVARVGPPHNQVLEIGHELCASALRIEQYMMRTADFDELEALLRTALPTVFAPAPAK